MGVWEFMKRAIKRNYYEILGVAFTANQQEIKKSYRQLALKHHPDRNPKDEYSEDKFKEITEAYEVLSSPQKRSKYDDKFSTPSSGTPGSAGWSNAEQFHWDEPSNELIRDIFRDILGYPIRRRKKGQKGEDLRYHLSIPFEVAALGRETEIEVPYYRLCTTCRGSKMKPGTSFKQCPRCKGKGKVKRKRGKLSFDSTCRKCKGEGKVMVQPCLRCKGKGKIKIIRSFTFKIPPGVKTGTRLRMFDKGNPGLNGGPPGDLYVVVNVNPHPVLEREGNDVIYHLPISFPQASLGTQVEVPTLEGKTLLNIPPGTQSGEVLRLEQEGIPFANGRGDQRVIVEVKIPSRLTAKQRKLLRQFAQIS